MRLERATDWNELRQQLWSRSVPFGSTVFGAHPGQPGPLRDCLLHPDELHAPTLISAVAMSPRADLHQLRGWPSGTDELCPFILSRRGLNWPAGFAWPVRLTAANCQWAICSHGKLQTLECSRAGTKLLGERGFPLGCLGALMSLLFPLPLFTDFWPEEQWLAPIKNSGQATISKLC